MALNKKELTELLSLLSWVNQTIGDANLRHTKKVLSRMINRVGEEIIHDTNRATTGRKDAPVLQRKTSEKT
jgi:hypothetical protein